ncbi:MAG: hypothetical protein IJU33_02145 [Bacteroidales bacterium]|nr:hypothetical protein [Bacteroidales bacterium]
MKKRTIIILVIAAVVVVGTIVLVKNWGKITGKETESDDGIQTKTNIRIKS